MRELSKKAKKRRAIVHLIENVIGCGAILLAIFIVVSAAALMCRAAGVA
jgi:hypothetical protein